MVQVLIRTSNSNNYVLLVVGVGVGVDVGVGVGVGVGVLTINGSPINQVSEYTYQCKPYLGQPYR